MKGESSLLEHWSILCSASYPSRSPILSLQRPPSTSICSEYRIAYIGPTPSSSLSPPHSPQTPLMQFPPRRAIHNDFFALIRRASTTDLSRIRSIPDEPEQHRHEDRAQYGSTQDTYHHQVAFSVLRRSRLPVRCPSAVKGIGRQDGPEVAQARYQSRGGSNADFAVTGLEDLVRPSHGDGYSRAQPKTDHQQTTVPRPWVRMAACVCRDKKPHNLNTGGGDEEEGTMVVEAV